MRHQMNQKELSGSISNAYIITLLIIFPPVGFYFAVKYRKKWTHNPVFIVGYVAYLVLLVVGFYFLGAYPEAIK